MSGWWPEVTTAAFDELYRRTAPWLTVRLRRRCADEQIVAEVLQETYLAVWRAAGSSPGAQSRDAPSGWLWTIAARRLVDAFRRRCPARRAAGAAAERRWRRRPRKRRWPGGRRRPRRRAAAAGAGTAAVLRAMVLDGLTVRETAVLLGLPEGTVKTRARRARIAMREALS